VRRANILLEADADFEGPNWFDAKIAETVASIYQRTIVPGGEGELR